MNAPVEVLIAGAGPTGLMLALWLTRSGVRVRIVDPRSGPVQETRAIAVQARTLEFYDQLEVGAEAIARGRPFDRVSLWARGRLAGALQLRGIGEALTPHPYAYVLTQDRNEELLVTALRGLGVQVDWQTELTAFEQTGSAVRATVTSTTGGQTETLEVAYLAGCDGARSRVRHQLGVEFSGGTYAHTFFVADVTASGLIVEGNINVELEESQFVAYFPMPGQHRFRIVGLLPEGAGERTTFDTVRGQVEGTGLVTVHEVHWFSTYRVHHRVAERFRSDRVFLLGDAAHVHSPVGGQGMNTGLGDAVNLGWKLAQALRGGDPRVLDTYDAERRPFARLLVQTTDRAFQVIVSPTPTARFIRTRIAPRVIPAATRLRAIRRLLFRFISQTRIAYPRSPLSRGHAGKLRGGDRLPWIVTDPPPAEGWRSNFEPLRSLQWQLHVYGEAPPQLRAWCEARAVPLHQLPFGNAAVRAGVIEGAPYLIRPDGHVGYAAPGFDRLSLDTYAERWLPPAR